MTDINLQNGCELWATFDSEDVDASRGIVRDRSGKGRTLEASGGPTYGQASPVGEAVSFDGTDDYFNTGDPLAADTQTVFALVKTDVLDASTHYIFSNESGGAGAILRIDTNDRLAFVVRDGTGTNIAATDPSISTNTYYYVIGVYDGSRVALFKDAEPQDERAVSTHTQGGNNATIGADPFAAGFWDGDIAAVGRWSRALSDAEIDQLSRMTDRMVSRL